MGYRSDVKIAMKAKDRLSMLNYRAALALEFGNHEHYEEFIAKAEWFDSGFRLHYEDIKWYPACDFVGLIKRSLDLALKHRGAFSFARCGEEASDVEIHYESFDVDVIDLCDAITTYTHTEFTYLINI